MKRFDAFLTAAAIAWGIGWVWRYLEIMFYGQIQVRTVDNIVSIIFLVVLYIYERRIQERW